MVRRGLALGVAAGVLAFGSAAAAQSSPDPLVAVLVEKGVISQADAAGVTTRDQLVKLLEAKGILSQTEVNSIAEAEPQMLAGSAGAPPTEAPVYFHEDHPTTVSLGPVDLTVGGFVDTMNVYRTSNTGNVVTTSFGAIPFDNAIAGQISEDRVTAQHSRLSLKAAGAFDWAGQPVHVVGYFEGDFNGNDATNVFVSTNGHTFRIRQFFLDAQRGPFEVLAGQAWSFMTPNRYGLSPDAVFTTNNYDAGYNVGLTFSRDAGFRVVYHATPNLAVGLAVDTPDQFTDGEVTFPSAFNAQLGTQFDAANQTTTPNAFPDILAKVAYDNKTPMGLPFHLEAVGLVSQFRAVYLLNPGFSVSPNPFTTASTTGWGIAVNGNVEVMPGLTVLGDAYYSEGGGRYANGLGPDVVVLPVPIGAVTRTVSGGVVTVCCSSLRLSDVQSESFLAGLEWKPNDSWTVSTYYGGAYFARNFAQDATSTAATQPFIGFGGPELANNHNKYVTEATIEPQYRIWSNPAGGALTTGLQVSYVWREPWFVAAGAPKWADLSMFLFDVRYTLP